MIKARVHLICTLPGEEPFSYQTDILALTRDPQWVYGEAIGHVIKALLEIKKPAHRINITAHTIEWVPTLKGKD